MLEDTLASSGAELIAVYGRRRIGKTFLIRSVYDKYLRFEFTGVHNAGMKEQNSTFILLINNMELKPEEIAALYKHRWKVELFFKWIKIKPFVLARLKVLEKNNSNLSFF